MVDSLDREDRCVAEEGDEEYREAPKHLNEEGKIGGGFADSVECTNREDPGFGRSGLPSARSSLKTLAKIIGFCDIVCLLHSLKDSWVAVLAD